MKVIVAGAFEYPMYQDALSEGLECLGIDVIRCVLTDARFYNIKIALKNGITLLDIVSKENPDILFLYRVENILPFFIKNIKKRYPQLIIMQYHNDDPFRKGFRRYLKSFMYLHCIKYTDITYVYRPVNLEEAKQWGAKNVNLFMSHYYSKIDYKELSYADCSNKNGKIVFIGHWEDDGRMDYICECFKHGLNLHIYGPDYWKDIFSKYNLPVGNLHPPVRGKDYYETIHNASIALAFFSKANRDQYTRRCFEIPIAGTALFQPSTSVTTSIFNDGENCVLYSNVEDLISKIDYYLSSQNKLSEIAYNGYCLIKNGPYSEKARAEMVIHDYMQMIKE